MSEPLSSIAAPLRAAMVRFPTIDPAHWPRVVRVLADLGFNAVDIPLVWREHERAAGVFDLAHGPLSVAAMLDTVSSAGLRAIVRLGPMASDDAPGLCVPERVLRDRECQARTRRQNPVLVPDPPRMVPLPSIASRAYRAEATRWIEAAARALAPYAESIARVILGDGPQALLRDDPFEIDHHPDARGTLAAIEPPHEGPQAAALEEVARETARMVSFREELARAAVDAGLPAERITIAVPGAPSISPAAHALSALWPLALPSPPPIAGSLSIWRQVRHALALARRGAHVDLWSGGPAYYPPTRGSHTVAAARVALAAGARDFSVRMGCAGKRWIGALLSSRGDARPHAHLWRELLAWASELPEGEEIAADLPEPEGLAAAARAASSIHPLPLGLAALVGLLPAQIACDEAPLAGKRAAHAWEEATAAIERALLEAALPVRRVPHGCAGPLSPKRGESLERFAQRAAEALAEVAPRVEPAGAALVRALQSGSRTTLVVLSRSAEPARVAPPARGWPEGEGARDLPPGAVLTFTREATRTPRRARQVPRTSDARSAKTGTKRATRARRGQHT